MYLERFESQMKSQFLLSILFLVNEVNTNSRFSAPILSAKVPT